MSSEPAETSAAEAAAHEVPLRKRPIPDQLDHWSTKLAELLDARKLSHDTIVAIGAAVVSLGVMATEVRALLDEREQRVSRIEHDAALARALHWQSLAEQATAAPIRDAGNYRIEADHAQQDHWINVVHTACGRYIFGNLADPDQLDVATLLSLIAAHHCDPDAPETRDA